MEPTVTDPMGNDEDVMLILLSIAELYDINDISVKNSLTAISFLLIEKQFQTLTEREEP